MKQTETEDTIQKATRNILRTSGFSDMSFSNRLHAQRIGQAGESDRVEPARSTTPTPTPGLPHRCSALYLPPISSATRCARASRFAAKNMPRAATVCRPAVLQGRRGGGSGAGQLT